MAARFPKSLPRLIWTGRDGCVWSMHGSAQGRSLGAGENAYARSVGSCDRPVPADGVHAGGACRGSIAFPRGRTGAAAPGTCGNASTTARRRYTDHDMAAGPLGLEWRGLGVGGRRLRAAGPSHRGLGTRPLGAAARRRLHLGAWPLACGLTNQRVIGPYSRVATSLRTGSAR